MPRDGAGPGTPPGAAQATPKEQFDAVIGPLRSWWRHCQGVLRSQPGPEQLRQLAAAGEHLRDLGDDQARSAEAGQVFTAAVRMIADLTCFLGGAGNDVSGIARFWARSGLLAPRPAGAGLPSRAENLTSLPPLLRERVGVLAAAAGARPDPAQAMALVTALRLAGIRPRSRQVTHVSVLFDKTGSSGGASGVLEIRELPGGPAGLYPDPEAMSFVRADGEFTGALASAWSFALRGQAVRNCLLWRLILDDEAPVPFLRGASLGAAFAIALREHFRKWLSLRRPWDPLRAAFVGLRPRCAITGAIAPGDRLAAVGGMRAKLEAAQARNWRLVAPAENRDASVYAPDGLHVYWAATLRQASRYGRRWRPVRTGIAALAIALVVAVTVTVRLSGQVAGEKAAAAARQFVTDSGALSASAPVMSRLDAVAASRLAPSDDARQAMRNAAALPQLAVFNASGGIGSVAFSPDGTTLAVATGSEGAVPSEVQLWDVPARRQAGYLPVLASSQVGNGVGPLAFSPDGKILALGTDDGSVVLWNLRSRRRVGDFRTNPYGIGSPVALLAFSPDSRTLATATLDGTAQFWNVAAGKQTGAALRLTDGSAPPSAMAFSSDGATLEAVIPDTAAKGTEAPGKLVQWNVGTRREAGVSFTLAGTYYPLRGAVTFSPDGTTLAVGSYRPQLWDVATHRRTAFLPKPPGEPSQVAAIVFSADGKTLATYNGNGTTEIWDAATLQVIAALPATHGSVETLALSPDGTTLATGSDGGTHLWNVAAASPFTATRAVGAVAYTPVTRTVATTVAGHPGQVRLWNVATGRPAGLLPSVDASGVGTASFGPDGTVLAVGYNDGTIGLWDVTTRQLIGDPLPYPGQWTNNGKVGAWMPGDRPDPARLAFSPDGKTLLTGYFLGRAQLWSVATHRMTGQLDIHASVTAVAFSPDGKSVATASGDYYVQLWNEASLQRAGAPLSVAAAPFAITFSANGKTLAAGYFDGSVRLWNVISRRQLGAPVTVAANFDAIEVMAFSPDGSTLAVGSQNGTVQLLDVPTWQPIGGPLIGSGFTGTVHALAFTPDGRTLITGTGTGTLLWHTGYLANPVPYLCQLAGQPLTPAEWARNAPGVPYRSVCSLRRSGALTDSLKN